MIPVDMKGLSEVYECSASSARDLRVIYHKAFGTFCDGVGRLIRSLGESIEDDAWKGILRSLRRYRFLLSGAPLPFNDPSVVPGDLDLQLKQLEALRLVYPRQAEMASGLLFLLTDLVICSDNPFFRLLSELAATLSGSGALLLADSRPVSRTEQILATNSNTQRLSVVTATQLAREKCFDTVFVLGASRWFPPYVFTAPRAKRICLVRYSWVRDSMVSGKTFVAIIGNKISSVSYPPEQGTSDPSDAMCNAEELLPVINWGDINRKVVSSEIDSPLEAVEACTVVLEGELAVFLETAEGSSVLTINLDSDESVERVARVPVREIRRGTFVLLRTSGGGDYIVSIADRLFLRSQAADLRGAQREWKNRLRKEVDRSSMLEVSIRLLDLGSNCANEFNLRNWLSLRSIRTHDQVDFKAMMNLVGLGDEWEDYWTKMGQIDHAHRQAGQYMRKQLLLRLEQSDLRDLERSGRMDFKLPDADAGSITAFRVVEISPETRLVPVTRVGAPFDI